MLSLGSVANDTRACLDGCYMQTVYKSSKSIVAQLWGPYLSIAMFFSIVCLNLLSEFRKRECSPLMVVFVPLSAPGSPRCGALPETPEKTCSVSPGDRIPSDPCAHRPVISYHLPHLESFQVL